MNKENITDPAAQVAEGDRYYNGEGIKQNLAKAVEWYEKAAKQGYSEGQYYLGYCYYAGEGVDQDFEQAVQWYTKAAEQGHPRAQQKLGSCYYNGEGVDQNLEKTIYWYKKSAEQGRAYAQYLLGVCYYDGEGVEKDFTQAACWFEKASDQNDDSAQCMLGLCYYYGTGVDMDYTKAVLWLEKSAEQDNIDAQYYLGDCYYNGEGIDEDHAKAAFWYEKAAVQGHPTAQFKIAYRYLKGDGIECDVQKAISWWTKSAEQGYDRSQYSLGVCYNSGEGVEKDLEKAFYWFSKAAEQNHADSCVELAEMYFKGEGVRFDLEKGAYWFRTAAETGEPIIMLNFGQWLLGEADGRQEVIDEGLQWIEKAASEDEHDEAEIIWQARWVLAEIYEYGLYKIKKDFYKAKGYYELLVENGDESAAVYVKLLNQEKEDPVFSRGWSVKHLAAKILLEDFPEFDAAGSLYEKEENYQDVEFTADEKKECISTAEKILMLADKAMRENILAFAKIAEKEEDIYLKTALKIAADGIRADLFNEIIKVLFVKERPKGSCLLKRFIIRHGIYQIITGDFTELKLRVMLGSLYVPQVLMPPAASGDRKYKTTFNYLLTHREIPRLYFESLNDFYQKIIPDPEMMQRFLIFAYGRAKYIAAENPDIEPAYDIEKFEMYMFEETKGRSVIVITLPKCDTPPESYQIAIPTARQKAGYFTCELSVDPTINEPCFILGEWTAENKHQNYGKIEIKSETSFALKVVELAYGKPLKTPPFDRSNMIFDTPNQELYCEKCGTTNFFYNDNKPPYHCDNCGAELKEA